MDLQRDTYAVVDLKRLRNNVEKIYESYQRPLMAVIKASAYGHGYKQVAAYLKDLAYIEMFAVATLPEAIELRKLGINKGILILGAVPTTKEDIDLAIEYDISLTMVSLPYLALLTKLITDKPLKIHIKIDTGMHRIGLTSRLELEELMTKIDLNKFDIEGIFTHFATADGDQQAYEKQRTLFKEIIKGYDYKWVHCANSAAMLYHQDDIGNLGRIGIVMYGLDPAGNENADLQQVMALYTKVVMVKKILRGEQVGYGLTYTAAKDQFIATLPIGYADGLIRKNQGRQVYIRGKYYPIVGRVCMDQMMVAVDETVKVGDQVEIFGDHISLERMAKELDTISYEIVCLLSQRVPRIYRR